MRTKQYVALLILAVVLGVVISFLVYWYLKLIADIQTWVFTDLPKDLGFHGEPPWWPLLPLAVAGAIVGATIRYLPGRGGHSPADGFKAGGVAQSAELPGIFLAALAGLGLGAVIGPEAPLIALGGGLAVLAVKLARRDAPASTGAVIAAAGSFAAISTLFGNPLAAAFLLLEASGLGGPMATIVLIPGLLGAGIGYLIFLGLNVWTGYGTFSLAIPNLPAAAHLDVAQLGWAVAIGAAAAVVSFGIRWLALFLRPHVERRLVLLTPLVGLVIAGLAIAFAEGPGNRHLRCCSPARRRSRRCSSMPRATRSERWCCWWCARGSRTPCRCAASAAARPSRPCSSAQRACWGSRWASITTPGWPTARW